MTVYGYIRKDSSTAMLKGRTIFEQEIALKRSGIQKLGVDCADDLERCNENINLLKTIVKAGDTVVVTSLDQFSLKLDEALGIVKEFLDKGVSVNVLNVGLLKPGESSEIFFKTVAAVHDFEQCNLFKRAYERKHIARTKNGFVEGRPRIPDDVIETALNKIMEFGYSYKQVAKEFGISESTLYKAAARKRGEGVIK